MPSNTTNFNWIKPTVGSDDDVWGDYLDTNLDNQDGLIRRFMNNFINSSAPSEAQAGTTWLDNTSNPYVWKIYDGSDWIILGTLNTSTNSFNAPTVSNYIGDMKLSLQAANHGSWILCNGQSLSTSTYSGLFALIGYSFGGSGATFLAPDLRGQVAGAIGQGSYSGASLRTIGQFVGAESHTLTIPEMPSHNHHSGNETFLTTFPGGGNSVNPGGIVGTNEITANTGGGGAHNNMQPTLFAGNYFIFSGV